MADQDPPRTRLEQLLRQRHLTVEDFRREYEKIGQGAALSDRQAYRWVTGKLHSLPHPSARAVLEQMFGEPVARLFGPPYGITALQASRRHNEVTTRRGTACTHWEGQVMVMISDRAREFMARIEANNVGPETIEQFFDDLARLVVDYLQQPLPVVLSELVSLQDRAFELLEGRQRPDQTQDLYLVAGITCGLLAMAARDYGAIHDAMTQTRAGYACADNARHDGLRVWIRGLQANIAYWAGRWDDAVRYARLGAEPATRTRSTAVVLLASCEARALGALNRMDEAQAAITRGHEARDRVVPDELDALGGLCDFLPPNQLIYAAEGLSWGAAAEASQAEQLALESLRLYPAAIQGVPFRNEANARCILAVARLTHREIDGASEALGPVLALPATQRDHTIITAVERVRTTLGTIPDPAQEIIDLAGAIEAFTADHLTRTE